MTTYTIYIKSHCEAPDYEDTCEAKTLDEAAAIFAKRIHNVSFEDTWEKEELKRHIYSEQDLRELAIDHLRQDEEKEIRTGESDGNNYFLHEPHECHSSPSSHRVPPHEEERK